MAVAPFTVAVKVIEFVLTLDNVALLIVTNPLRLSALPVLVTNAKEGLKVQVGF